MRKVINPTSGWIRSTLALLVVVAATGFITNLPKVFVVGDSISIQYGPYLEQYLGDKVLYDRKKDTPGQKAEANLDYPVGANGGDSRMVLSYLQDKLREADFRPDVLLLNCGLHDIKRNPKTLAYQVDSVSYRQNLEEIHTLLKNRNIPLVWVRTTAVVDTLHNRKSSSFHRFSQDAQAYNRIADEVWKRHGVPVIDLYNFTRNLPGLNYIDHVHYNEPTRSLQAAYIAGYMRAYLKL